MAVGWVGAVFAVLEITLVAGISVSVEVEREDSALWRRHGGLR